MDYEQGIIDAKASYPFQRWRSYYDGGLDQYTAANCEAAKRILDDLISKLVMLGEDAEEVEKVSCFKYAIEALNQLDAATGLIETGEAEELCSLINTITLSVGLVPENYGDGEGLASEWRDW